MRCPTCNAANPPESQRCQSCGKTLPLPASRPAPDDELDVLPAEPVSAEDADTPRPARRRAKDQEADIVSIFIPYKNPRALAAYYCGFFAFIPGIGIVLGLLAILLGILGVRYSTANPTAKGAAHAITGIVLGVVALFCWNPLVGFLLWFTYFYLE
jgi:hypothetical protein